jgi:PPM family protein phosphatase
VRIATGTAASNTGRKRRTNEDAFVYDPPLFAVADGMGGARAGEVASSLAASALREAEIDASDGAESLVIELIQNANRRVHERAVSDSAASGMGTTMTVALFQPEGSVVIGHVGDSRAYVLRDGRLEQLTEDHSLVAELVRRGELSPEQAEVHPQRSVITRALGTEPEVDVDAFTIEAREGDVFLLCSDGLTTMVEPARIAELVQANRSDLEAASRALIRLANERGGEDNITTVLFAVASDGPEPPADPTAEAATGFEEEDTLHPGELEALEPTLADGQAVDPSLTIIAPGAALAPEGGGERAAAAVEPLPVARLVLSILLVVALSALVVFLVVKGFAQ